MVTLTCPLKTKSAISLDSERHCGGGTLSAVRLIEQGALVERNSLHNYIKILYGWFCNALQNEYSCLQGLLRLERRSLIPKILKERCTQITLSEGRNDEDNPLPRVLGPLSNLYRRTNRRTG